MFGGNKVVVTGGCGMVGKYLVDMLVEQGAEVYVVDDMSRGKNVRHGVYYIPADAGVPHNLYAAMEGAFAVFNLAARVAGVLYNSKNQLEMFWKNARLQTVPAMVAAEFGVPYFLQVSSVCVYDSQYYKYGPITEDYGRLGEPGAANNGYSWSKRIGERVGDWANFAAFVTVRPSNMAGKYDYFGEGSHVIPALVQKFYENEVVKVFGDPGVKREFIHPRDAAAGMILALTHGNHRQIYNLGSGGKNIVTIGELVKMVAAETLNHDKEIVWVPGPAGGDDVRESDCSLLAPFFRSTIGLQKIVQDVERWYWERR